MLFRSDDAPYSLPNYMVNVVGDTDVKATKWTDEDNEADNSNGGGDGSCGTVTVKTRTIEYVHPVNAPMAPPTAKARKEQKLRKYGNHGLIIETETYVKDVPMTDCFYIKDILRIERKDDESSSSLLLNFRFEVVFVKSTYFQSMITRTSRSEIKKEVAILVDWLNKFSCTHCKHPVRFSF